MNKEVLWKSPSPLDLDMEKVLMNLVLDLEIISTASLQLNKSWKLSIYSAALWVQFLGYKIFIFSVISHNFFTV